MLSMKKYYCITVLALLVVILLQGYNMSLQYKDYIYNETDKTNSVLPKIRKPYQWQSQWQ